MSLSQVQVVNNIWHCDRIGCLDPDIESVVNPHIRFEIHKPSIPAHPPLILDICSVCVLLLPAPLLQVWVAALPTE